MSADITVSQRTPPLKLSISRQVYNYADFNDQYGESVRQHRPISLTIREATAKACDCSRDKWIQRLLNLLPLIGMFKAGQYSRTDLVSDILAGIMICVLQVPQGLAYGLLTGLKPVTGLYTSLVPVFIFALIGRSQHLSIGTFALMSLLLSDMIGKNYESYLPRIVASNSSTGVPLNYTDVEYAKLQTAIVGSFSASLIILAIGLLRLGFIMRYLSEAMLLGFMTGAATQGIVSQLPLLFGVYPQRSSIPFKIVGSLTNLFNVIHQTNFVTLSLSAGCYAVLYLVREYVSPLVKQKTKLPFPIELIVIVITLLASQFADMNGQLQVAVVGDIPRGLPSLILPDLGFLPTVFVASLPVAIVGTIATLALAKMYCLQFQYSYNFSEDFVTLGISSLVSTCFQCYFPCGALARNAVVVSAGMKSQIANFVGCALMLLVLLAIGPYFKPIPTCVLACIINVSLANVVLQQMLEVPRVWRTSPVDCCVWFVTLMGVLVFDVNYGLAIGFVFNLFSVILRTQSPRIFIMGQIGDTDIYKNVLMYSAAKEPPGLKIVRFDAPLNFANAERFRKVVNRLATQLKASNLLSAPVHTIIFDCSSWVYVDLDGLRTVKETYVCLTKLGYRVLFANCKESAKILLFLQDFCKDVDWSLFLVGLHDAVTYASCVPPAWLVGKDAGEKATPRSPSPSNGPGNGGRVFTFDEAATNL